jgi:hypothetical protein
MTVWKNSTIAFSVDAEDLLVREEEALSFVDVDADCLDGRARLRVSLTPGPVRPVLDELVDAGGVDLFELRSAL